MNTDRVLEILTTQAGVSGTESMISNCAIKMLEEYCDSCKVDRLGNVIGFIKGMKGKKEKKRIMLEAHMDRVGFIVTDIDSDGLISFAAVGGIDARILPCLRVSVLGEEKIKGVILAPSDESVAEKNAEIKALKIYTGYSEAELKGLVALGDIIMFDSGYLSLLGSRRCSAAMDNRSGMTAVFAALEYLKAHPADADIYVMFSTQEEVGLRGAFTGTFDIDPDMAIVVDVTHGTTVDSKDDSGVFDLGSGAAILRGPNVDYDMAKELISIAQRNNVDYKIETAGGASGTTAWAIQTVRCGVPSLLISIPLRYMHTNVEIAELDDIEAAGRLMGLAAEYFGREAG